MNFEAFLQILKLFQKSCDVIYKLTLISKLFHVIFKLYFIIQPPIFPKFAVAIAAKITSTSPTLSCTAGKFCSRS